LDQIIKHVQDDCRTPFSLFRLAELNEFMLYTTVVEIGSDAGCVPSGRFLVGNQMSLASSSVMDNGAERSIKNMSAKVKAE
jgi:hypothetical protein